MSYSSIAWLPLCAGLTVLGLVISYLVGRRRGRRAMLRGAAWSLLPVAAYLTGSIAMFWKIGVAIGQFAGGFVFSPVKWAGIGVAGLAVVLFLATRGRERRRAGKTARQAARRDRQPAAAEGAAGGAGELARTSTLPTGVSLPGEPEKVPAQRKPKPGKPDTGKPDTGKPDSGKAAGADDDMKDIEEILRNRGL